MELEANILYYFYSSCPDIIELNGHTISGDEIDATECRKINISPGSDDDINTVKLKWNNNLITMHSMFENLDNLVEIDLSMFDSSSVISMAQIFRLCTSLTSINFSGITTSLVETMHMTFADCYSLKEFFILF